MTKMGSLAEWQEIAAIAKNLPFRFRPLADQIERVTTNPDP